MMNKEREIPDISELDFISRLPHDLIHHIFSFLTSRDVSCASVLSKTWNHIWSIYPYAVFNLIFSNDDEEKKEPTDEQHLERDKLVFLNVIEKSVHRRLQREFFMERFQMYIDFPDVELLAPYLDRGIRIALERCVPELAIRVDSLLGGLRSHYMAPQIVLLADSLKVLCLSGCMFEEKLDINLPHLQKLSLCHCSFADKLVFYRIIYGCPVIQYVKVSSCKLMDHLLMISSLPELQHAEFLHCDGVTDVTVNVSSLHTFSFASVTGQWPRSINLSTCVALKELKLNGASFPDGCLPQPLISQLPALEVLEMQNCFAALGFRISSRSLKRLVITDCKNMSAAEVDTPNLHSFDYCRCDGPFIPVNASIDLKVHLIFTLRGKSVEWLTKLKHFLSILSCCEDLKLVVFRASKIQRYQAFKDMIIHEKLSKVSFSSLNNFMNPMSICISLRSCSDLLDELFPVAYPENLFSTCSGGKLEEILSRKMEDFRCNHPVCVID